jgi:hypothetical protein
MSDVITDEQELVGKTVADVEIGYEELTFTFEDGSTFTQSLGVGNHRDI